MKEIMILQRPQSNAVGLNFLLYINTQYLLKKVILMHLFLRTEKMKFKENESYYSKSKKDLMLKA